MSTSREVFDKATALMNTSEWTIEGNLTTREMLGECDQTVVLVPSLITTLGLKELLEEFDSAFYSRSIGGFVLH